MATDPNQILATAIPAGGGYGPASGGYGPNPFIQHPVFGQAPTMQNWQPGPGLSNIIQAAQSGDPNAWSTFLAQPWAQSLQQRFNISPAIMDHIHQALTGMGAPRNVMPYFQPPQVGMVPGVPGSVATNPAPGSGYQQQQGWRNGGSPMLPNFAGLPTGGGPGHYGPPGQGQDPRMQPMAGVARTPGAPGFGL